MQNPKKRNQKMRKMRLMSGVLAVTMTASLLALPAQAASISDFTDVEGHWAYDALEWAVENDVLAGKDHDTMDPDGLLTGGEIFCFFHYSFPLPYFENRPWGRTASMMISTT